MNAETARKIYESADHYFQGNHCLKCGISLSAAKDPKVECRRVDQ